MSAGWGGLFLLVFGGVFVVYAGPLFDWAWAANQCRPLMPKQITPGRRRFNIVGFRILGTLFVQG